MNIQGPRIWLDTDHHCGDFKTKQWWAITFLIFTHTEGKKNPWQHSVTNVYH